jgi:hypothetical protein
MSDTPQSIPLLDHLRNRERELGQVIDDATARRKEVRDIIQSLGDGRTRVGRLIREAPVAHGNGEVERMQQDSTAKNYGDTNAAMSGHPPEAP